MYRPPFRGPSSRDLMLKPGYRKNILPSTTAIPPKLTLPSPTQQQLLPSIQEPIEENPVQPFPFASTFLYTEAQLKLSPSFRKHKIKAEEEMILRRVGTCFIKQLSSRINAKFPQQKISARATCMAMVYFHRFYMYHSLATFLPIEMATTCLFLAAKVENCPKRVACFSDYYFRLTHDDDRLESHEYEIVNELIQAYETKLLQTLVFEFRIELPHIVIINSTFHSESDLLKKIAWSFSTDMLAFTTLCLQYDKNALAAAAFYIAGAYLKINMKKQYGEKWLQSIAAEMTEDILKEIVDIFLKALTDMKVIIQSKKYELEEGEIL
uniref:Cyclin-like domain-containing protein n=1 Tax=Panagrolaimus sp. PS1159 TaxID=55785 RepID=A0AC35FPH7_9BILA